MASRFVTPVFQALDSKGKALPGAKLFFFEVGSSSTLKNTFTDETAITDNSNPVIADGAGIFPNIYGVGQYRVVLQNRKGSQQWARDNAAWADASDLTAIATGSTESRTLADRFSDSLSVKDFGAIGDGATDDTVAFAAAISAANTANKSLSLEGNTYNVDVIDGLTQVISDNATIKLNSLLGVAVDLEITGELNITSDINVTTASNVAVSGSSLIITVANSSLFSIGDHCLITDSSTLAVQGLYAITAVGASDITVDGSHSQNTTTAFTANVQSFVSQIQGIKATGICSITNILVNATGLYGIQSGGGQDTTNDRRKGQIQLDKVGVFGASDVGVIASNGSSIGILDVGTFDCNKGIMAFRNGTVMGTRGSCNNTNGDGFICEHSSNMIVTFYLSANSITQSGVSARYSSANSMVDGVVADNAAFGSIAQFVSYMAFRDNTVSNSGFSGVFSTDNSTTVTENVITTGSSQASFRITDGGQLQDLGGSDFSGDIDPTFDHSSSVELGGIKYSGVTKTASQTPGAIAGGGRVAFFFTDSGLIADFNVLPVVTLNTDLNNGLIFTYAFLKSTNQIRYYITNTTAGSLNPGTVDITINW